MNNNSEAGTPATKRGPGRPKLTQTAADRAALECAAALEGQECEICASPATTARTQPQFKPFAALRGGSTPNVREEALASLRNFRCDNHSLKGRPPLREEPVMIRAKQRINRLMASRPCDDPGCNEKPTGGITETFYPNIGQFRSGAMPDLLEKALETAYIYCTPHLAARTAVSARPDEELPAIVEEFSGPYRMVLALVGITDVNDLADMYSKPVDRVRVAYDAIGINIDMVISRQRGDRPEPVKLGMRFDPAAAWMEASWRDIDALGPVPNTLTELAKAVSGNDLARNLTGGAHGHASRMVTLAMSGLGVDLPVYLQARLRDRRR